MLIQLKKTNDNWPFVKKGVYYLVVQIDDENFRIVDDRGEALLYGREEFEVVDASIPDDWIRDDYLDGEYFIRPPEFAFSGFFEDVADGRPEACATFAEVFERLRRWQEKCGSGTYHPHP